MRFSPGCKCCGGGGGPCSDCQELPAQWGLHVEGVTNRLCIPSQLSCEDANGDWILVYKGTCVWQTEPVFPSGWRMCGEPIGGAPMWTLVLSPSLIVLGGGAYLASGNYRFDGGWNCTGPVTLSLYDPHPLCNYPQFLTIIPL